MCRRDGCADEGADATVGSVASGTRAVRYRPAARSLYYAD